MLYLSTIVAHTDTWEEDFVGITINNKWTQSNITFYLWVWNSRIPIALSLCLWTTNDLDFKLTRQVFNLTLHEYQALIYYHVWFLSHEYNVKMFDWLMFEMFFRKHWITCWEYKKVKQRHNNLACSQCICEPNLIHAFYSHWIRY